MTVLDKLKGMKNEISRATAKPTEWYDEPIGEEDYQYENVETDNVRWELNYTDVLTDYERTLRNLKMNSKGQWVPRTGTTAEMNELGIASTMSKLRSIMHKGTPLGATKDDYVREFTKYYTKEYKKDLIINFARYEVRKTSIGPLVLSFMQQVYSVMTRSIGDAERKIRAKRYGHSEKYSHNEVSADEIASGLKV